MIGKDTENRPLCFVAIEEGQLPELFVTPDGWRKCKASADQFALTAKIDPAFRKFIADGREIFLETLNEKRRAHAAISSRTSILPVTAAVIRAVRYSCRRSTASLTFSTSAANFAVSTSR